jgi:hypothetical protein
MIDFHEAKKKALSEVMRWPRYKLEIYYKCELKYQQKLLEAQKMIEQRYQ